VNKAGIGSHTKPNQGDTNTWLTPQHIVQALGTFDLDPCAAPSPRPWPTAKYHIELPEDGLAASWCGSWCPKCGAIKFGIPIGLSNESGRLRFRCFCGEQVLEQPQPYRVFLNPPYGKETDAWLEKMSTHPSGIALIFARTETATWQTWVWPFAKAVFFLDGRLFFHHPDGTRGKSNAGGPSALISYSHADTQAIRDSGLKGYLTTTLERLS
jgi:hypothetical protein